MNAVELKSESSAALWVCRLLHAGDSAYPTGAYAHSFGLEGLVEAGVVRDRASLRGFLLGQFVPQLARSELPLAMRAWSAMQGEPDWARLGMLCYLGRALRGTRELRAASEAVGKQRMEMAALLHGGLATEFLRRANEAGWPIPSCVAAAVEGAILGAPCEAVLQALLYAAVSGWVTAAVKLLRLGQNAVQTLVAEGLGQCSKILDTAAGIAEDDIGSFNPWWDIASSRHEHADFRLFIS